MDSEQGEPLEYNQCQEAVRKLNEYLSHELQAEEEKMLHQHLSQCRGCFSKFHFEETLLRTIRSKVEQVHAPMSLRGKILNLLGRPEATSEGAPAP